MNVYMATILLYKIKANYVVLVLDKYTISTEIQFKLLKEKYTIQKTQIQKEDKLLVFIFEPLFCESGSFKIKILYYIFVITKHFL